MPLARRSKSSGDEVQRTHQRRDAENCDARDPQIRAQLFAWSGIGEGAQRRVAGPAMQWSSSSHKESRQYHHESDERSPERKHVQDRKRHIRCADLDGQKIVPESALRRRRQHEEHHNRAVHGQQAQVGFGLDLAYQRQNRRRPDHVKAHQQRQKHADKHRHQRQKVVLQPDDFVIQAENIFADKALRSPCEWIVAEVAITVSPPPESPTTYQNLPGSQPSACRASCNARVRKARRRQSRNRQPQSV